jgi:hypothetical protein
MMHYRGDLLSTTYLHDPWRTLIIAFEKQNILVILLHASYDSVTGSKSILTQQIATYQMLTKQHGDAFHEYKAVNPNNNTRLRL